MLPALAVIAGALALPASASAATATPARAASAKAPATRGRVLLTQGQALARAHKTGKPVQVTAATTDSSTLTANPSGSLTLSEQNVPVRKEVNGTWKALDPTLHRNADGLVSPLVTTGALTLSGGGTGPLISLITQGHTLSLSLPGTLPVPALSGATATYANVPAPGIDLQVTADTQGDFEDVLVVRNAAAARSPALRSFSLRPSVTGGLVLRTDSHGNLTAASRGGRAFFEIPAATMWDSRTPAAGTVKTATDPATGRPIDLRDGQPVTSAAASPGEDARKALVATRFSGGTLTYTPSQSVLAGKGAVYPVYIDPAAGSIEKYWAQVDSYWPSQTYPKPSPMQVGFDGWDSPNFIARSFVNESVPTIMQGSSTDVESATLYLTDEYAPACAQGQGDFGVQVWLTGGVSTSTDWSNQPSWTTEQQERSFADGYDPAKCAAKSEGFNVLNAMTTGAHDSWSQVTFGIKADNEGDEFGWKKFSSTVTLSTTYDKPPDAPANLKTSPVTSCTASPPTTVGLGDVTLYATLDDPLGAGAGSLTATVNVTDDVTGKAVTGSPFTFTGLGSGSITTVLLTEATLKGLAGTTVTEFSWNATVTDGTLTSPASKTCTFSFNPSSPGAPSVCPSTGCPPLPAPAYTIGTAASFTVTPDAATITPTSYNYQLNGAAPHTVTADKNGDATIPVTPTSGADVLTVTAIAAGGNLGQSASVFFTAGAPANAADGDMTGDGIPDLVTPGGGTTGLAPGLWQASGQAATGDTSGDGQLISSTVDIGAEGNGFAGDYSPGDFTGAQAITGLFNGNGLQDTLVYYPSGTYAGYGAILDGNGDGTALDDEDASNTREIKADTFTQEDPNGDIPLEVANGYTADPSDARDTYPDLITVSGDATNNYYYLEYYQNGGSTASWAVADPLSTTTPDGTMDWNAWRITTMQDPSSGGVDMFLYNQSAGELYLWTNWTINDFTGTSSYTAQYDLSGFTPGTLSEIRAADITGTGPALWTVDTSGNATAWIASPATSTITAQPAQSLLDPTHDWRLGDQPSGTPGTITTAADTGDGTAGTYPLAGHSGTTWDDGGLFNPAAAFDASGGAYMTASNSQGMFNNSQAYTVSAWVRPSILGGVVLAQTGSVNSCMAINISTVTSGGTTHGVWNYQMSNADTSGVAWTAATTSDQNYVKLGTWTHLTATYNPAADYMRLYVNGIPAASATPVDAWSGGCDSFELGRLQQDDEYHGYFNGDIANVQVWKGTTLTPTEEAATSGTPGYVLFPSDGTHLTATATPTTWTWKTACGEMNFYQGLLSVKETCTASSTITEGTSGNTAAYLTLQGDGNLVIYNSGKALWDSATNGNSGDVMFLQPDGNLVIYGTYGQALWSTNTQNAPPNT